MTRWGPEKDTAEKMFPWSVGKGFDFSDGFDFSAPVSPITAKSHLGGIFDAEFYLKVNGVDQKRTRASNLFLNCAEIIKNLSQAWELQPGDLIFTGSGGNTKDTN